MSRYAMCPNCGSRMHRVTDMWGNWDGETYECYKCSGDDYDEYDDYDDGERISVSDAADIWMSSGKDEDNMFGYSVEELEDAL